ncbi:helix-turn-helix domain-containing protein [Nocardia sp. NPDC023988]|uniref:TetR/AcrR family transcriptional regulator n=1 Tax=unclassified Nocardia TaxID=2637762 RepID=UPI0033CFE35A
MPRVRRRPEEARQAILDAAATLLTEGGPSAVQVRAVAARVGMTDAGVTHHFRNRQTLLTELLRHGGRRLRAGLANIVATWLDDNADLPALITALHDFYRGGYADLAVALHAAGWRDRGSGMLDPVVEALHRARPPGSSLDDTRLAVAALHQAVALDVRYGNAFRRSAGLTDAAATFDAHAQWWARHLETTLGLSAPGRVQGSST